MTNELVTIDMVKAANKVKSTNALSNLIEKMETLDQGKISILEFESARDAIECNNCKQKMSAQTETGLCEPCRIKKEKAERAERARRKEEADWWNLHHELSELDKAYKVVSPKDDSYDKSLKITISNGEDHCTICREQMSGGSGFHSRIRRSALRIYTNDYDVKADRLQKDFSSKNVALHLHNKCNELFKKIQDKKDRIKAKEERNDTLAQKIVKAFPDAGDIQEVWSYPSRGRGHKTDSVEFKTGGWRIKTYDGERFTVSLTRKFNPKDMNEFIKTIKTFDSKKME